MTEQKQKRYSSEKKKRNKKDRKSILYVEYYNTIVFYCNRTIVSFKPQFRNQAKTTTFQKLFMFRFHFHPDPAPQVSHRQFSPHLQKSLPTPATALGHVQGLHPQCSPHGHHRCAASPPAVSTFAVAHLQALPPGQGTAQPQLWLQALIPPPPPLLPASAITSSFTSSPFSIDPPLLPITVFHLYLQGLCPQMTLLFFFRLTRACARGFLPRHGFTEFCYCLVNKMRSSLCRFVLSRRRRYRLLSNSKIKLFPPKLI